MTWVKSSSLLQNVHGQRQFCQDKYAGGAWQTTGIWPAFGNWCNKSIGRHYCWANGTSTDWQRCPFPSINLTSLLPLTIRAKREPWHGSGQRTTHLNVGVGIFGSSRDPEGIWVVSPHVDKQWLACAIPRRKARTSQRVNSSYGHTRAEYNKSISCDGLPRAQPCWCVHDQYMSVRLNCMNSGRKVLTYLYWTSGDHTSRYISMWHWPFQTVKIDGNDSDMFGVQLKCGFPYHEGHY